MSKPVQVAYLIAAHRDPEQCRRLLGALIDDGSVAFVHVDSRVTARDFQLAHPRAIFLDRRIPVNRGGWSQARVMMRLLSAAHSQTTADYFVYLAATDYPIKPRSEIASFLAASHPWNFLNYYPLLDGTSGRTNLTRYHFVDTAVRMSDALGLRSPGPVERQEFFTGLTTWLNDRLPRRSFPTGWVPFRGSSRWCLDRETVGYLLATWKSPRSRALRRYLRFSWGSDEVLVQTLVFNSAFAERCRQYDAAAVRDILGGHLPPWEDERRPFLHYIDWDPSREDPAILDGRDFDRLRNSTALFACKFSSQRSGELLDLIDSRLRRA